MTRRTPSREPDLLQYFRQTAEFAFVRPAIPADYVPTGVFRHRVRGAVLAADFTAGTFTLADDPEPDEFDDRATL